VEALFEWVKLDAKEQVFILSYVILTN
jgi:hypothetical protein